VAPPYGTEPATSLSTIVHWAPPVPTVGWYHPPVTTSARLNPSYSEEELLEAIRLHAAELGRTPTLREMDRHPLMPSAFTFKYRFKAWSNAVRLALGEDAEIAQLRTRASEEKLRTDLRQLAARLGRIPTVAEMNAVEGAYHANTYIRRFGSWTEAVAEILQGDD
jgi:hypothetical protein